MDPVRLSADLALLAFLIAWLCRVGFRSRSQAVAERWLYAAGALLMLVHIVLAYGIFHRWSHAAALQHTAEQTEAVVGLSFAGGLYFNFVFVLVYLVDVVWRFRLREPDARQPRWLAITVDGFLLFIVAMSTIVFETGPVRHVACVGLLAIAVGQWRRQRSRRPAY